MNDVCCQAFNVLIKHNFTNVKVPFLFVFYRKITVAAMTNGHFKMVTNGMHKGGHSTKACGRVPERFRGKLKQILYVSEVVVLL